MHAKRIPPALADIGRTHLCSLDVSERYRELALQGEDLVHAPDAGHQPVSVELNLSHDHSNVLVTASGHLTRPLTRTSSASTRPVDGASSLASAVLDVGLRLP